jgi:hypothetical protein
VKRTLSILTALVGLGIALAAPRVAAFATGTTAGTTISNTATATYSDGTNTYNSQSNTVTTTVQNAPSLTIAPPQTTPGANTVSPGGPMTDTYTLTNTGNNSGYFQVTGTQATNDGVTAGQAAFVQYVVNASGSPQTFTTIAAVNTYLSTGNAGGPFLTAVSGTITIGVQYTANAGASGTITTLLTPDIVYPAGSGTTLQTSSTVIGQYSDPVQSDARVDVQKIAAVGGTVVAPTVTYTVRFADGGSRNLAPVFKNALPGGNAASYDSSCTNSTACGVVFTDKIPSYNATQLTLNGTPSISGATGTVIYSVDGTTWTTTSTGAVYVGVFLPATSLTGVSLVTFAPNSNTTSQGNVPSANAALTLTFTINGSTATGAANTTAITNVANSIFADQSGYIEGPGITYQSVSNGSSATTANTAPAIANTTGTLAGSGQAQSAASPTNAAVLNGTYNVGTSTAYPGATGPDGTTATDFTALSYTNGATLLSAVNGANVTVPASAAALTFTNSLQNNGNKDDILTLTAATGTGLTALPTGWTVTFQSTGQTASGSCAAVTAGTVITSVCVTSGSTQIYKVVFTPPASVTTFTAYTGYGDAITATSTNNNTITNLTTDEMFVGGFVKLSKTLGDAAGAPCSTATVFTTGAANVNPGDCVQFTVTYANVAPGQGSGANNQTLNASNVVVTENGTAAGGTQVAYTNNWATYTNGLYAAPADSNGGTLAGYNPGPGAAGSSAFTDTVSTLPAGTSGSVAFKVQVK